MELAPFTYEDQQVRILTVDGEPWFVLADLCKVLGLTQPNKVALRLADDMKGRNLIPTPGGAQEMTIVSEAGMYEVVIRSDKPDAKTFRRWITAEVLPSIRKTGSYGAVRELTEDELIHKALTLTAAKVEKLTARLALVEPKATAFDLWLSSNVDYSVGHVANALAAVGVPDMGRTRLFRWLNEHRWAYKADGQWTPYQTAMETKRRTVTLRITAKGAADLAVKLGVMPEAVAEALAATIEEVAA